LVDDNVTRHIVWSLLFEKVTAIYVFWPTRPEY